MQGNRFRGIFHCLFNGLPLIHHQRLNKGNDIIIVHEPMVTNPYKDRYSFIAEKSANKANYFFSTKGVLYGKTQQRAHDP